MWKGGKILHGLKFLFTNEVLTLWCAFVFNLCTLINSWFPFSHTVVGASCCGNDAGMLGEKLVRCFKRLDTGAEMTFKSNWLHYRSFGIFIWKKMLISPFFNSPILPDCYVLVYHIGEKYSEVCGCTCQSVK